MEKLIDTVLEQYRDTNLHSAAGRQAIIKEIMKKIRSGKEGWFLNMNTIDGRIPDVTDKEEESKWVCEHCDESTFDVDYDYIGSNYNHLTCDLKDEQKELYEDAGDGTMLKVKDDLQKKIYNELTTDGLPLGGDAQAVLESHKLAEEIVDNKGKWIYESPDGGKTVFRRPFGDYDMKKKEEIDWETKKPTGRKFTQYPFPDDE